MGCGSVADSVCPWAKAKALGKMGQAAADSAPELAACLQDEDPAAWRVFET